MQTKKKEPVRLRRKNLANGNVSLYLAIYTNGHRSYEFLRLYLIPEKTKADKRQNQQTLALAEAIKSQRVLDIQAGLYGFTSGIKPSVLFFDYFDNLTQQRKKDESRGNYCTWLGCAKHLREYEPRKTLTFADITQSWVQGYRDYLEHEATAYDRRSQTKKRPLTQNTRALYLCKLRTCLQTALKEGIINKDPSEGVPGFRPEESKREYLTIEQVRALAAAECDNAVVKRAFLFSCLTGLRRSDIERLTWGEVAMLDGRVRLVFRQKKTGGQEYLDITSQAAELLGQQDNRAHSAKVFDGLPWPRETGLFLRAWCLRAGIDKAITFHCARHTFAVMMLTLGTDLYTVSKLLGHRDIKTTQIYAKVVDAKKQEAVDNIPGIF